MENTSTFTKSENGRCMPTSKTSNRFNFTKLKKYSTMPTMQEWKRLWSSWDLVTTTMINHNTMLFEQPIDLRHPFIFYLGHIPTFVDVMITRHKVDCVHEEQPLTEPAMFADIFERGIDPDMDDPTQCNPHSKVPGQGNWPGINSILQYQQRVRNRLSQLLLRWESNDNTIVGENGELKPSRKRCARVVWMCFEHEAMHLETLLYMILQSPNFKHPSVSPPSWYKRNGEHKYQNKEPIPSILRNADMIAFDRANVEIGHDDFEDRDSSCSLPQGIREFGWDNEHPKRVIAVLPFELQTRPVTNGEYWLFWKDTDYDKVMLPASWKIQNHNEVHDLPKVKTSFGLCEFQIAVNWPVQVSSQQAEAYAASKKNGMRLPTEPEWIHFRRTMENRGNSKLKKQDSRNFGFTFWTPQPLNNEEMHVVGDVWEWTSTIFKYYDGFTISQLYPGYSADFFDGKHRVVLGASWATHQRIAERISFRNWYQWRYPYVFCGFRLCRSL